MLYSGVWVRNDCPVLRIEFSAVEVGRPVSEGSVRQDGVVAGSQQGLSKQRHASPFASGVPPLFIPFHLQVFTRAHHWRVTVSPCQVFSDAVLIVSVAAALEIDVAVVACQVLPPPRHVVGDEHENHVVVLRSEVLECVLRLHPHSRNQCT